MSDAQAGRIAVLPVADLPPGKSVAVDAFGTTIAVFNVDGNLFALENRCAHHGGPLCFGRVSGALVPSGPYEYVYQPGRPIVTCPWHGWEYDLETGRTLFDQGVFVRTFAVGTENGQVVLTESAIG